MLSLAKEYFSLWIPENTIMICFDLHVWIEAQCAPASYFSLWLSNMLLVEEKLAIQIADIDGVQVDLKIKNNFFYKKFHHWNDVIMFPSPVQFGTQLEWIISLASHRPILNLKIFSSNLKPKSNRIPKAFCYCTINLAEKHLLVVLTISISPKPDSTKFFNTSQPMPPAPTTSTLLSTIFFCKFSSKTPGIEAAILRR